MTGNIIGESISEYVKDQISQRQIIHGSGFDGERSLDDINYLNSNTSWVKMVSSVKINSNSEQLDAKIPEGKERIKKIGLDPNKYSGDSLAKSAVLFNSISKIDVETKTQQDSISGVEFTSTEFKGYTFGSGINKDSNSIWNTNNSYGLGGLEFGIQPPPGIKSFSVNHLNRGSIRKGIVNLKAYNKVQFEIIELLYLRLGFTMFIEWGNSIYIDNKGERNNITNTLVEDFWFKNNNTSENYPTLLKKIEKKRKNNDGNYDGFCGRVVNFSWNFSPDGSYDINIELASLGDVIESLTVNNFYYNEPYSTSPNKDNSSTNIISNFFEIVRTQGKIQNLEDEKEKIKNKNRIINIEEKLKKIKEGGFDEEIKKYTNYIPECIDFSQITLDKGFNNKWWGSGDRPNDQYGYYIKFGAFLNFIQDKVLPRISASGKPILQIKNDPNSNFMYCNPMQFAIDPRICFVRNDFLPKFANTEFSYKSVFKNNPTTIKNPTSENIKLLSEKFDPWLIDLNGQFLGSIMDVYLNFAFIETLLKNLQSKDSSKVTLYTFLQNICNGINKSLGGLNKLEPVIDEDSNSITFLDSALDPSPLLDIVNESGSSDNTFEVYGYNPVKGTSNFVKDFNFQTEIDPKLATMLTIGATSIGSVVGEDATAFSKWNEGLEDRYNPKILEPQAIADFQKIKQKNINQFKFLTPEEKKQLDYAERQQYSRDESNFIKEKRLENETEYNRSNFAGYLVECFGGSINGVDGKTISIPKRAAKYANFDDPNFIERGYIVIRNNIENIQKQLQQNSGEIQSTIGFIPIRLSLVIDGLSGIKIYNKLVLNTKFLPSNYPDSIDFLITQVNHELKDNNWVTTLETISVPKQTKVSIKDLLEEENKEYITPEGGNAERIPVDELKPSKNIYIYIAQKEGFRAEAYDDRQPNKKLSKGDKILGTLTIGYGTTEFPPLLGPISENENYGEGKVQIGDKISKTTALQLLERYIRDSEPKIKRWLKVPLTQNEYDALISFTYNTGPGESNKETFVSLLNRSDYTGAGNSLRLYNKSKGVELPGLNVRRQEELELWMRNNPGNPS